ncbi:hypothetical protein ASF61_15870 [Duganella sp. Leaf126]|uniref:sensor histidine kinase n=1 Tax=Duganella sp. Leaf126 TaxID=1736266 RepID=UPI0006F6AE44|nr:sensor histidine kinase [Duganella sp. Leaf126]KQQ32498.1 hypothetical protein ASF61_15870 [Duganella sp. Leaf126]
MPRIIFTLIALMLVLLADLAAAGAALPAATTPVAPQPTIMQAFHHQAWKAGKGVPVQIHAITQSSDGYLWLASDDGLYRFDGTNFDRIDAIGGHRLRSPHAMTVLAEADGGLWVSYRYGGVSYFKNDQEIYYGKDQGFPDAMAFQLARGPDGRMWATTSQGMASLDNGRWVMADTARDLGAEAGVVTRMLFARDGTHWIASGNGAYYRAPGSARYVRAWPRGVHLDQLTETAAGDILASNGLAHIYRIARTPVPAQPVLQGAAVWTDRAGALWTAHADSLEWLPGGAPAAPRQVLGPTQGLSGREPQTFFEDRDGNLWIGTNNGLDRLRRWRVTPVPAAMRILSSAMVPGRDATMWISEDRLSARRFDVQGRALQRVPYPFAMGLNTADGGIVLGSRTGIWFEDGNTLIPAAPEALRQDTDISTFARDGQGVWWANFRGVALMRRIGDQWQPARDSVAGLPPDRPRTMHTDAGGQLWLGFPHSTLVRYANGAVTAFGAGQGLDLGDINVVYSRRGRLWGAGDKGVAWFDGSRFHGLALAGGQALRGVSGIVETAAGELWLRSLDGLYRIDAVEVSGAIRDGKAVHYELFDIDDGVGPPISLVGPFPSVLEAGDGRLWVASYEGVATIMPGDIRRDLHAPLVEIRGVTSNGVHYRPAAPLRLPEGSNNLDISFGALSLTRPERTQFRYRLRGVDTDWQHAGTRRDIVYTKLPPGRYTFEVSASNEYGVWDSKGDALDFEIAPQIWQATWFRLAALAVLIAILIIYHRRRVAAASARAAELSATRLEERERIARTLHDDLLQGVHALVLKCATILSRLPKDSHEERILESALDQAEKLMANTRDEVMALRQDLSSAQMLADLHDDIEKLEPTTGGRLKLGVSRELVHVRPDVTREVCQIFKEAVINACRHSQATRIVATIAISGTLLEVSVMDNGVGITPQAAASGIPGHFGIVGMRERVQKLGAVLTIERNPGGGTVLRFGLDVGYRNLG